MIHILSVITGLSQLFNVYSESCGSVQVANYGIVHNEPCGSVQPIYGMALKGHVFQTLRVPSSLHCLKACNNDIRCQSINHLMGKDMCELNNRTIEARPENLIPDSTKLYMKRFKNRGKRVLTELMTELYVTYCDAKYPVFNSPPHHIRHFLSYCHRLSLILRRMNLPYRKRRRLVQKPIILSVEKP